MIRFPILLLALATCVPGFDITRSVSDAPDLVTFLRSPRACFTPCGVRVTAGDCDSIQRYEGRVLAKIAPAGNWDAGTICEDLAGFTLNVHRHDDIADRDCGRSGWWRSTPCDRSPPSDEDGGACGCIAGLTSGGSKTITVATTDWEHGAFAHEVAHVADGNQPGHCPWLPPLLAALYDVSRRVDPSSPDPVLCSPDGGHYQ